jgi:hypothetical protein
MAYLSVFYALAETWRYPPNRGPKQGDEEMHRRAIRPAMQLEESASLADPRQVSADKYPPLLATKIMPPRRAPGLIHRERLLGLVDQVQAKALTVIRAAAGFGKTSLGGAWAEHLHRAGHCVAWLSLDADDDEPTRFLFHVAYVLRRSSSGPRRTGDQPAAGDFPGPSEHDCRDADYPRVSEVCFWTPPGAGLMAASRSMTDWSPCAASLQRIACTM